MTTPTPERATPLVTLSEQATESMQAGVELLRVIHRNLAKQDHPDEMLQGMVTSMLCTVATAGQLWADHLSELPQDQDAHWTANDAMMRSITEFAAEVIDEINELLPLLEGKQRKYAACSMAFFFNAMGDAMEYLDDRHRCDGEQLTDQQEEVLAWLDESTEWAEEER